MTFRQLPHPPQDPRNTSSSQRSLGKEHTALTFLLNLNDLTQLPSLPIDLDPIM